MKQFSIFFCFLICACASQAQFAIVPANARQSALGGCRLLPDDSTRIEVSYRCGYGLKAMSTRLLSASVNTGALGTAHGLFSHFGDADYGEMQAAAGYSMRVSERFSVGVEGRYCRLSLADGRYPSRQWLAMAARVRMRVSDYLSLSLSGGTRPWDEGLPFCLRASMAWQPVSGLLALAEVESEERLRMRLGMEYAYRGHFFFRAGLSTAPVIVAFGLGVRYCRYIVDVAAESHPTLGLTPQISLALCL